MSDNNDNFKSKTPGLPTVTSATPLPTTVEQPQKKKSFASYLKNVNQRKQELADLHKRKKEEQLAKAQQEKEDQLRKLESEESERKKKQQEAKKAEEEKRHMELKILEEIRKREEERKKEEIRRNNQLEIQKKECEEQAKKLESLKKEQNELRKKEELRQEEQEKRNSEQLIQIQEKLKEDDKAKIDSQKQDTTIPDKSVIQSSIIKPKIPENHKTDDVLHKSTVSEYPSNLKEISSNPEINKQDSIPTRDHPSRSFSSPQNQPFTSTALTKEQSNEIALSKLFDDIDNAETIRAEIPKSSVSNGNTKAERFDSSKQKQETDQNIHDAQSLNTVSIRSNLSSLSSISTAPKYEFTQISEQSSVPANPPESQLKLLASPVKTYDEEDVLTPFYQTSPLTALPSEATLPPSSIERHIINRKPLAEYPASIPEASETSSHSIESPSTHNSDTIDSDTETVVGDSPLKPKRGRLIRKSELENNELFNSNRTRLVGFSNEELSEIQHQRSRKPKNNKSQSRSSSPRPIVTHSKKKVVKDASGRSKLQIACMKGRYEDAIAFINEGYDINDQDYGGISSLHEAALNGFTDIVELLLKKGASVNIRSIPQESDTPLIDAVANGHLDTIKVLLNYGADPRLENSSGQNALDALNEDCTDAEEIKSLLKLATLDLIRKEKKKNKRNGLQSDGKKKSAAVTHNTASRRPENPIIDLTTKAGRDELLPRAANGDLHFVGTFLDNGGEPDIEAFALAAKHGHDDILNVMMAFGAKINAYTEKGTTALMQTLGRNQLKTVKFLLSAGADPTKRIKDGNKSTLDFAIDSLISDEEEIRLIMEAIEKMERPKKVSKEKNISRPQSANGVSDSEKQKKRKSTPHGLDSDSESQSKKKKQSKSVTPDSQNLNTENTPILTTAVTPVKEVKRVLSSSNLDVTPVQKKMKPLNDSPRMQSPTPKIEATSLVETPLPFESEDEKKNRLLKEKIDREKYEASKEAKRKAREEEYMRSMLSIEELRVKEKEEARKREEAKLKEEQKAKELKQKQENDRKELMSKKEETVRRHALRQLYPHGLKIATFNEDRTPKDASKYLPLFSSVEGSGKYISDLQVLLVLGKEDFHVKYNTLEKRLMTADEKAKMFNFFYRFLGDFKGPTSTIVRQQDQEKQQALYKDLLLNWIKLEDFLHIVETDYPSLSEVVNTDITNLDLSNMSLPPPGSKTIFPQNLHNEEDKELDAKVLALSKDKRIPISMRFRPDLLRTLLRANKLW